MHIQLIKKEEILHKQVCASTHTMQAWQTQFSAKLFL